MNCTVLREVVYMSGEWHSSETNWPATGYFGVLDGIIHSSGLKCRVCTEVQQHGKLQSAQCQK